MNTILVLAALLFTPLAFASNSAQSPEQFMQSYLDGYEKYLAAPDNPDVAWVTAHFSEPLVMMPPSGPAPSATRAAFAPNIKYFIDNALKAKGVVKLEWAKLQIALLSDTQALASGLVNALDKNGATLEQRASIYLLTRGSEGWAVSVNLPHSPSTVPTIN